MPSTKIIDGIRVRSDEEEDYRARHKAVLAPGGPTSKGPAKGTRKAPAKSDGTQGDQSDD